MADGARAWPRARGVVALGLVLAFGLAGCQRYQPMPLDLHAHRAAVQDRLADARSLAAEDARAAALLAEHAPDAPQRFDPSDGLTPAEGEVLALFFNPDLRQARLRAGAALATYQTAGRWEDPVFGFDGAQVLAGGGALDAGLTLGLTLPISGSLRAEKRRALAAHQAELSALADAQWATRMQVRRAWSAWSISVQRCDAYERALDRAQRLADRSRRLVSLGELTRAQARMLETVVLLARVRLGQAQAQRDRDRLELLGLMGLSPNADVRLLPAAAPLTPADRRVLAEALAAVPSPGEPLPAAFGGVQDPDGADAPGGPEGALIERLLEANTTLAVERAQYRLAERALRAEIRRQYPDLTIGTGFGRESHEDRLLLGVSIPIPILNANAQGIARARADRAIAMAKAQSALERAVGALSAGVWAYRAADRRYELYREHLVPTLEAQLAEQEALAELGQVDLLLLVESVDRLSEAHSEMLDARLERTLAALEVVELLGPEPTADDGRPANLQAKATPADDRGAQAPAARRETMP
ncbi:MAG: divalent cation transporter [Phycisphaerales bacterium]|nr:MAG: divalent cation transporter [Phycisphaerales bacterium]